MEDNFPNKVKDIKFKILGHGKAKQDKCEEKYTNVHQGQMPTNHR